MAGSTASENCWCAMKKLELSFIALNYLAAAIIVLRKVPTKINIIYG
jgi:hypothetical protein